MITNTENTSPEWEPEDDWAAFFRETVADPAATPSSSLVNEYEDMVATSLARQQIARDRERQRQTAAQRRQEVVMQGMGLFYARHPALHPDNMASVEALGVSYDTVLAQSQQVGPALSVTLGFAPEHSALYFAAASILGQSTRTVGQKLIRQSTDILSQNQQSAREYLLRNMWLLAMPDGIRSYSDQGLARYNGITHVELDSMGVQITPRRLCPFLAVLAADIVHTKYSSVMPAEGVDPKLSHTGELLAYELRGLATMNDTHKSRGLYEARLQNLSKDDRRALTEYGKLRQVRETLDDRKQILQMVARAARWHYGFERHDNDKLDIMAELMVAEAHDFNDPATPDHVKHAVATRLATAARKNKVRSADDLPPGLARELYTTCMTYRGSTPAMLGRFLSWLAETDAPQDTGTTTANDTA